MNEAKSLDQALAEAFSKADHLQAPLDQRLKLYLGESRKLLPEMEATYDQLVAFNKELRADCLKQSGPIFEHTNWLITIMIWKNE